MKKQLSNAFAAMLGRDKETAEERAFRHERENYIKQLVPAAVLGIIISEMMQVLVSATLQQMLEVLILCIFTELILFGIINSVLKWHQNKHGGE